MVIVAAHVALVLVGAIVVGNAATAAEVPVWRQFAATAPFWVVALVGTVRLVGRGISSPRVDAARVDAARVDAARVDAASGGPVGMVDALGLRPPSGWRVGALDVLGAAAGGVVAQLVLIPAVYAPLLRLFDTSSDALEKPARELVAAATSPTDRVLLTVMVCVMAPLVEELLYRWVLFTPLARRSAAGAIAITAVVFGAAHFQPLQFVGLALLGVFNAVLVARRGWLGPAIASHVAFNLATLIVLWLA